MSFLVEFCVIFLSLSFITVFRLVNKNPPAILNVYQRPNGFFYSKFIFIFILLSVQKLVQKLRRKLKKQAEMKKLVEIDRPQKLTAHPKAIDAVYFNGGNKNGDYLVVGIARRKNKLVDGFMFLCLKNSGLGVLETLKLPGTSLYQTEETETYEAKGISISPQVPMKRWRISFAGQMRRNKYRNQIADVRVEAEWNATAPCFNFDTDMSAYATAKSMAYEQFSKEYFENLKANHQTHYEQFGAIRGVVSINSHKYSLNINTVRDHSFGMKRQWENFHRYALHYITTENGDMFNVSVISLPISFSRLTIGYVYSAKDDKIYPVTSCNLQLHQHGEDGNPPSDYAFGFVAGGKEYIMQVNVLHSPHFYLSQDWESKVIERLCTFEVNGVKGWGASEFQYRNVNGIKPRCAKIHICLQCYQDIRNEKRSDYTVVACSSIAAHLLLFMQTWHEMGNSHKLKFCNVKNTL